MLSTEQLTPTSVRARVARGHDNPRTRAYLIAIVAAGAVLRLLYLGTKSLWLDEGSSYIEAITGTWHHLDSFWAYMALYYVLLRGWLHLGDSEFFIRLLSVIPAVATVPVVYALGKKFFGRRVGLWSAALLACHAAHVSFSQEARSYALAVLFCATAALFLARAVESLAASDFALWVLFSALAVYSHFMAALVVAAHVISLVALPARSIPWRGLIAGVVAFAAITLPLPLLIVRGPVGTPWMPRFSLGFVPLLAGGPVPLLAYVVLWAVAAAVAWRIWTHFGRSMPSWHVALLVSWALAPMLLLVLLSVMKPAFVPRYLLMSVPAAVILAARGLVELRLRPRMVLAVATIALSLAAVAYSYTRPKEDWRGASGYVFAEAAAGDAALVLPSSATWPFVYYQRRAGSLLPVEAASDPAPGIAFRERMARHRRVWVLVYTRSPDAVTRATMAALAREFRLSSTQKFKFIDVYLYATGE